MFGNLSGIIGIAIDALVVIIVVIALMSGAKKGFVKMARGLVSSIAVLAITFLATSPVALLIKTATTLDDKLSQALETPLVKYVPNPYAAISYFDDDSDESTPGILIYTVDGEQKSYDKIFEGNTVFTLLGGAKTLQPMVEKSLETADNVYLIKVITGTITGAILLVGTFIILAIVSKIVISLLFLLFKKAVSSLYIMHFFDKFLGLVFGAALGLVIIVVIVTIMQMLQSFTFMDPVNIILEKTYITKFIAEHNYLYKLIAAKFDLAGLLAKLSI